MQQPTLANPNQGGAPTRRVSPISPDAATRQTYGGSILARPGDAPEVAQQPLIVEPASIGVTVFEPGDGTRGLEIASFRDDSLADQAGMRVGDIIVGVNGTATTSTREVAEQMREFVGGDVVRVDLLRNRQPFSLEIPLVSRSTASVPAAETKPDEPSPMKQADRPSAAKTASPTIAASARPTFDNEATKATAAPNSVATSIQQSTKTASVTEAIMPQPIAIETEPTLAAQDVSTTPSSIDFGIDSEDVAGVRGALITTVTPGSPAASAGVKVGDRIVSINGRLLINSESLRRQMKSRMVGDEVSIQLVRGAKLIAADVRFADPNDATAATKKSESGGRESLTQGIGSMLGGLFGGENKSSKKADDAMAFGDDETVKRVGFDDIAPAKNPNENGGTKTDPPSLETMELPAGEATAIDAPPSDAAKAESEAELKNRIRELEQKLNELKKAKSE